MNINSKRFIIAEKYHKDKIWMFIFKTWQTLPRFGGNKVRN